MRTNVLILIMYKTKQINTSWVALNFLKTHRSFYSLALVTILHTKMEKNSGKNNLKWIRLYSSVIRVGFAALIYAFAFRIENSNFQLYVFKQKQKKDIGLLQMYLSITINSTYQKTKWTNEKQSKKIMSVKYTIKHLLRNVSIRFDDLKSKFNLFG